MKVIKSHPNYIIVEDIYGSPVLYERLSNTIHDASTASIRPVLKALEQNIPRITFKRVIPKDLNRARMRSLVLNVTEDCNLRCRYCIYSGRYFHERIHSAKSMSRRTAMGALNEFFNSSSGRRFVLFYGGEPLLRSDIIFEVAEEVCSKDRDGLARIGMTTNFTLARPLLPIFAKHRFLLIISLDGPQHIHDSNRRDVFRKGTWGEIDRAIRELATSNPDYYNSNVGFSVTISDIDLLSEICKYFSGSLYFNAPMTIQQVDPRYLRDQISPKKHRVGAGDEFKRLARLYADMIITARPVSSFMRALFDKTILTIHARQDTNIGIVSRATGQCWPGFRKLFVDTDGFYYMCEKMGRRLQIGNVRSGLNLDLVSEAYNKYISIKERVCCGCWAIRLCTSCAASAKSPRGITTMGQGLTCSILRDKIINGLSIYSYIIRNDTERNYTHYYGALAKEVYYEENTTCYDE